MVRLSKSFFGDNALEVAPLLLGKRLCRKFLNGDVIKYEISEVEAYCGEGDLACHASKGRTPRTEVMYAEGGKVYVYLIYGMYWLLNFVCGDEGDPQAVLIRGVREVSGPGRLGKALDLDKTFYGEDLTLSDRIWIEDAPVVKEYGRSCRIGVDYAGPIWSKKKWRFVIK